MVEKIQEYHIKSHKIVERMPPEILPWQEYVYRLLEDVKMGVHEEDGHNSSFDLRIGHVSILNSAEKEKNFAELRTMYLYIYKSV
jgi:hypothetical protein